MLGWMESCPIPLEKNKLLPKDVQKNTQVYAVESYMCLSGVNFGQVTSLC